MVALPFELEHRLAWIVAGCFAILSGLITCYQVYCHIKFNSQPALRRHVIRIILMVPIYALQSWLGLRFASIALYFDLLRECYEAFVIYSFYQLLVTYLGGERELVKLLSRKPDHPHVFPFCLLPNWRMSDRFQIEFTETEMKELERSIAERRRTQRLAPETRASQSAIEEAKEDGAEGNGDIENPSSSAAESSATSTTTTTIATRAVAGSNPQPDYSGAASSPDLLPPSDHEPERPSFSSRPPRIPPTYLSPFSRPHHSDFLTHTQLGTLQYCIAKPITALLAFILNLMGLYGDSNFELTRGYPYLSFITNMSQIWAMYTLVLFYMVCKEDLAGLRPIPKFLCVKAVVFFTFWQSVLIAILASLDILHDTTNYTKEEVVVALQDFIVCIEMLLAALAHHFAFSWKHFHDPTLATHQPNQPILPALMEALNVTDVYMHDVRHVTTKSLKKKLKDNRILTREEMHDMQYASFVAETNHLNTEGGFNTNLIEPLNPAAEDSSSIHDSDGTYVSPLMHAPTNVTTSSTSGHRSHDSALVEHVHERHRVTEDLSDGSSRITVTETETIVISPRPSHSTPTTFNYPLASSSSSSSQAAPYPAASLSSVTIEELRPESPSLLESNTAEDPTTHQPTVDESQAHEEDDTATINQPTNADESTVETVDETVASSSSASATAPKGGNKKKKGKKR